MRNDYVMGSTQLWSLTQFEGKSCEWLQPLTQHCQASCLASRAADWAWISCRPDCGPGCRAATSVQCSMSELRLDWSPESISDRLSPLSSTRNCKTGNRAKETTFEPLPKEILRDGLAPSFLFFDHMESKKKKKRKKTEHLSSFWQGTHPPSVKPQA